MVTTHSRQQHTFGVELSRSGMDLPQFVSTHQQLSQGCLHPQPSWMQRRASGRQAPGAGSHSYSSKGTCCSRTRTGSDRQCQRNNGSHTLHPQPFQCKGANCGKETYELWNGSHYRCSINIRNKKEWDRKHQFCYDCAHNTGNRKKCPGKACMFPPERERQPNLIIKKEIGKHSYMKYNGFKILRAF